MMLERRSKGSKHFFKSLQHLGKAKPATKLVFMEDTVATLGGLLAVIAVTISHFTAFHQAEGIASVLIGIMMFFVVGKVFLDNAAGALGEADEEMEEKIGNIVMQDPSVKDIQDIQSLKRERTSMLNLKLKLNPTLTVAEADDIKDRLEERIMAEKGVADVIIEFDEDDGVSKWEEDNKEETNVIAKAAYLFRQLILFVG